MDLNLFLMSFFKYFQKMRILPTAAFVHLELANCRVLKIVFSVKYGHHATGARLK